ncbi:MAG: undecaprenyl-diphosphate phosphatase [Pyrinomonadaceae bacterium]
MTILQAIILGIVQGLTEFIPISSTAHLIFASRLLNLFGGNAEQTTATIAVVQLGTLLAVFVYFAGDIVRITLSFIRDHLAYIGLGNKRYFYHQNGFRPNWMADETWLGWLVIVGSIPIGTVGLLLKKVIEGSATKNLWLIAIMMIAVAVLLGIAELVGRRQKETKNLGIFDALAQGFAQCLALVPGASRSGSTIMAGLFAGQTRETAARFSFLLSIPAILASGLLELKEAWSLLSPNDFTPLIIGIVVAALIGYASIWFLLWFLRKHSSGVFIGYRIIVGTIILVLLWQGLIQP